MTIKSLRLSYVHIQYYYTCLSSILQVNKCYAQAYIILAHARLQHALFYFATRQLTSHFFPSNKNINTKTNRFCKYIYTPTDIQIHSIQLSRIHPVCIGFIPTLLCLSVSVRIRLYPSVFDRIRSYQTEFTTFESNSFESTCIRL